MQRDLSETVLAVLFLCALIGVSLWILLPFVPALLWAVMIVVATWPLLLQVQARLWGSRRLAVAAMTIGLLLVLVLPATMAIGMLLTNAQTLVEWAGALGSMQLPAPPGWLNRIPLVGPQLAGIWEQFSELSNRELLDRAAPYAADFARWLLPRLGSLGFIIVQFLLTVIVAAIIFANGESTGQLMLRFARRLAGIRGESAVVLAAQAIRGVALGVVGTALLQALFAGIGLAIAGVPFAALLTAATFVVTIAQLGPLFVLAPAVIWLYAGGDTGDATFLLVWTLIVTTGDNFVRPLLIKRGANLSLVLIFAGVIGGLLAFGVIGIFVGPVVLAVSWTLIRAWIESAPEPAPIPTQHGTAAGQSGK